MAGIIRGGQLADKASRHEVAFHFEDVSQRAAKYLEAARQQADLLLEKARQQSQQLLDKARADGRQQARHEAEQTALTSLNKQLVTLLPALKQAIDEIEQAKAGWVRHWEQQTVELAIRIAERVIRREVQQRPEITVDLIREALELGLGRGRLTVRLAPQDYEALKSRFDVLVRQIGRVAASDFVADPAVSPGGCLVTTEFGEIDQRMESQLERIRQELDG